MQCFMFHLMPWPYLPEDYQERYSSPWINLPNRHYDSAKGAELYQRYLDELEYAEELGFDGVCVNEHHQTAYGLMPSPNLIAAMLVRRTKRMRIGLMGNAIPLRDHPLRVAEEIAMLDLISGGRIISGFVRGIGCEYHSFSLNPVTSRDRFAEAHELIVRAWTDEGPFEFEGEHYRLRHVNLWPNPLQKPHPPIWIPSQGSVETIDFSARNRYPFIRTYTPVAGLARMFEELRQVARGYGYEAEPDLLGWMVPVYVGETDEQARREASEHLYYMLRKLFRFPFEYLMPPGYATEQSMRRMVEGGANVNMFGSMSYDELNEAGVVVCGGPETVRQRLVDYANDMRFGILVPLLHFGTLPHDLTVGSMERFAREVMPALRELNTATTPGAGVGSLMLRSAA